MLGISNFVIFKNLKSKNVIGSPIWTQVMKNKNTSVFSRQNKCLNIKIYLKKYKFLTNFINFDIKFMTQINTHACESEQKTRFVLRDGFLIRKVYKWIISSLKSNWKWSSRWENIKRKKERKNARKMNRVKVYAFYDHI